MNLKFVWADGALAFGSGFNAKVHHRDILKQMIENGLVKGPSIPDNYIAGDFSTDDFHGPQFDHISIVWQAGKHPTTEELRYLIQQELNRTARLAMYEKLALADVPPDMHTQPVMEQQQTGLPSVSTPPGIALNGPMVFTYRQTTPTHAASISLNQANIFTGHVAVWFGVNNQYGKWIQAGISMIKGATEGRLYFETGRDWYTQTSFQDLGPVALGQAVEIHAVQNRNSIWLDINGKRYGPVYLHGALTFQARAEDMHVKALPNQYSCTINPLGRQAKWRKQTMALLPEQLQAHMDQWGPYGYHTTPPHNINQILEQGIKGFNEEDENFDQGLGGTSRPGHSYLYVPTKNYPSGDANPLRVDLRKLDPTRFKFDEDFVEEHPDWRYDNATRFDLPDFVNEHPELDDPENVVKSLGHGTLAYEGDIPPEAVELNPPYWNNPKNVIEHGKAVQKHDEWQQKQDDIVRQHLENQAWLNNGGIVGKHGQWGWTADGRTYLWLPPTGSHDGLWMDKPNYPNEIEEAMEKMGIESEWKRRMKEIYGDLLSQGRTAMADRTGNPEIDAMIEEFLKEEIQEYGDGTIVDALRNPENSHGMCDIITEQFVQFAKERGFKAYVTQTDLDEMGYKPSIKPFGEVGFNENDEMEYGFYPEHTVASIYLDESQFPIIIDFTATQYGYTDHPKVSATTEDTEPKGSEVGFLADPHKELYPNLFRGEKEIPPEVVKILKNHVLEPLEQEFAKPDSFIYFTIYGSGISYNWSESGDLDLQLWVDSEKYANSTNVPMPIDDLLASVRRIVQPINFPTFNDLGLTETGDTEEITTGEMMIQYYPKAGTGSKEENLASQPYACYDLETDDWLVKPKAIKPKFYGDNFLLLTPKAKDIALQAEALLGEFQRNVLNFQFWFAMYSRYHKKEYRTQFVEAMKDATQEKEGIKTLFEGVFGGRAEAYSPGGTGIYDERDMIQKLLEVWGTFQDLKHFARAPLPWDTQELPLPTSKWSKMHFSDLHLLPENNLGKSDPLHQVAREYMDQQGLPYNPPTTYLPVDPARAKRVAEEYEKLEHNPNDPRVRASYQAMINETKAQYDHLLNNGYQFEFYPEGVDPYPSGPRAAVEDLRNNKHMYVYPTAAGFGEEGSTPQDHPLLEDSGERWNGQPVTHNDIFRAVHDAFGHGKEGVGFRHHGEENAWRQHAAMYSPLARPAMTAETRGQNSWVNFGPYGEFNQTANQADTIYAPQKAVVMPSWAYYEGAHDKLTKWTLQKTAVWADLMEKAQRLRDEGKVQIQLNEPNHVVGQVQGDHGTYETEIWRDDPNSGTITLWNCDCPWSQYSWGRTRQWKKYEGRPCAHTLALYWTALATPPQNPEQQQIPGMPAPQQPGQVNLPEALRQTVQPPQPSPGSQPQPAVKTQEPGQLTINFPGALSRWRKEGQFQNGDAVRVNQKVDGFDDRSTYHIVPRNSVGEVIWSDDEDTIVIFSLESGQLGPHNVRVTAPTAAFTLLPRTRGVAPRRRR